MKVWFNKKIIPLKKAKVSLLTHSLHYGSAVFEGIRCYQTKNGPAVFRLDDHLKRLFFSAKTISMKLPYSLKEIKSAVIKVIKINKLKECYIRPIAFFEEKMGLNPEKTPVSLAIAAWPWQAYLGNKPIKTIISSFIRPHPQSIISSAKISGYYINSVFASLEAKKKKANEAILKDYQGFIAEGPGENIFIVKKGKVFTPKTGSILPGITRATILKLLKDLKIKVQEKNISEKELKSADEAFFVGTAVEVCPIAQIDNVKINQGKIGPITEKIKTLYFQLVKGKIKKYYHWLTFVKN